nr:LEA type 2 family protein [uncultured Desulfobacter sp.]
MNKAFFTSLFLTMVFIFSGCAPLQPGFETPVVSISSFEALPSQGVVPQFEIGLHIVNPNRTALNLIGMVYTISLEGHKLVTGVTNELPVIEAYSEGDIFLNASVNLFSSIGFFTNLIRNQNLEKISYQFNAKLDVGTLHPVIRVTKKGELSLISKNLN